MSPSAHALAVTRYLREKIPLGTVDSKAIVRFAEKIEITTETGCWRWTATHNARVGSDPGRFYYLGKGWVAHRWAWEAIKGPVPEGLVLDHYLFPGGCIGPRCASPEHVTLATFRENVLRGNGPSARNARKTACPAGHPYDRVDTRGGRYCSICKAAHMRRYRAAA